MLEDLDKDTLENDYNNLTSKEFVEKYLTKDEIEKLITEYPFFAISIAALAGYIFKSLKR